MSGCTYQAGLVAGNVDEVIGCRAEGKVTVTSLPDEYGSLWNCNAGGICGRGDRVNLCTNSATVNASGWCAAGGVAGTGRSISKSANYGTVTTDYPNGIGGIVGESSNVWDSENHGIIVADVKGARIGGISGNASGNTTISGCVNYADFIVGTDSVGVGGIVAYPEADRYTAVKIKTCKNFGNIEISGLNSYGGGISGKAYAASFFNCINYGDVTVENNDAAGICSYATYHSNAYGCVNIGNIKTSKKGGGILGHSADATVGCVNYGEITGIGDDAVLGGLVGRCESSSCFIQYSINLGSISKGDYVGGIVDSSAWGGGMFSCYNGGDVSASRPRAWVGGLAGYAGFSIHDCYNVGGIHVTGEGTLVGGLVGKIFCGSSQWSTVSSSFNMG